MSLRTPGCFGYYNVCMPTHTRVHVALLVVDLMERVVALPTFPHPSDTVIERGILLANSVRSAGGLVVWIRVERPGVAVWRRVSQKATTASRYATLTRSVKRVALECACLRQALTATMPE